MELAVGVDIGGTKIAAGIIDAAGNIHARQEFPSVKHDANALYDAVISIIEQILQQAEVSANDVVGIGIGVPGKVDEEHGVVAHQNNLPFVDFPLGASVKKHFQIDHVFVANDVKMATVAEWKATDEKENTLVYVTISTGIACSMIHRGAFLQGAGFSGELGLLPIKSDIPVKDTVRLEDVASGPAIARKASILESRGLDAIPHTTEAVFERYEQGDTACKKIVHEAFADIAEGIYGVVCILDPNKIVFGGGVINHHPYLVEVLKEHLQPYLARGQEDVLQRLYLSHYQENAGIIGAAFQILKGLSFLK